MPAGFAGDANQRRARDQAEVTGFDRALAAQQAGARVVRGLKGARIGAIGARPAAFNTVRFSEKLLEHAGISIETLDLSEVFGRAARLPGASFADPGKAQDMVGTHTKVGSG